MIKAILFDLDNTLLETRKIAEQADLAAMECFAKKTGKTKEEVYKIFQEVVKGVAQSKNPKLRTRRHSYRLLGMELNVFDETIEQAYKAFFDMVIKNITLVDGAKATLDFAKQKGWKLAILTENEQEFALAKLKKFHLIDYFDVIITATEAGTMKPSNRYFQLAMEQLGVRPTDCIVVGDDFEKDLADAEKAGARVVLFRGEDGIQSHAQFQQLLKEKL